MTPWFFKRCQFTVAHTEFEMTDRSLLRRCTDMDPFPASRGEDHKPALASFTFRPSFGIFKQKWLRYAKGAAAFIVALEVADAIYYLYHPDRLYLPLLGGMVLLAIIWYGLYLRNVVIKIDPVNVWLVDIFGRTRAVLRGQLTGVALRGIVWPGILVAPQELAIVYRNDHRCVFKLRRLFWGPDQILQLRQVIGHGHSLEFKIVYAADLEKEFPGSLAWWERHNWVAGTLLALVLGAVVLLLIRVDG
jgi:hypothetical protein